MPYNVQNRLDTLGTRMSEINVDPQGSITYHRGSQSVVISDVALGRMELEELGNGGQSLLIVRYFDFFFAAASLSLDDTIVRPQIGDVIERAGGDCHTVVQPANKDNCYQFITNSRTRLRVHTRLDGTPVIGRLQ